MVEHILKCVWEQTAEENVWPTKDDDKEESRKIYNKNAHNMHYSSNIQWESAVASIAYYEHFFMHCQFNYVKHSNINWS